MVLEKAKLIEVNRRGQEQTSNQIEFMFNPSEISFSRSMSIEQARGARNRDSQNRISFKHPNPYSLNINNIILDTYETGEDVLKYISQFQRGVEFSNLAEDNAKRPPVYIFTWGQRKYMHCFIKSLNFKLSLFLSDGTPVRAVVNLSLEQINVPDQPQSPGLTLMGPQERQSQGRRDMPNS